MNALKTLTTTVTSSASIIRRSASTMYRNSSSYKRYTSSYDKDRLNKDLEKYVEYRRECWSDYLRKMEKIKIENTIKQDYDIIEWETEKALEHAFRN